MKGTLARIETGVMAGVEVINKVNEKPVADIKSFEEAIISD